MSVKSGTDSSTINITGSGSALVEVEGGNNKITHTGTGESILKGTLITTSGKTVDVTAGTGTGSFFAVTLADAAGQNKQTVAWAGENGSNIDISGRSGNIVLIGSTNEDKADQLYGGNGNNTIYASEGDSVYGGGAGSNHIYLDTSATGEVVGIGTAGKDTVTGFTAGFDSGESDKRYFTSVSGNMAVKTSGKEVQITNGSAAMKLENLKLTNGTAELIVNDRKLAAAGSGSTIQASGAGYAD